MSASAMYVLDVEEITAGDGGEVYYAGCDNAAAALTHSGVRTAEAHIACGSSIGTRTLRRGRGMGRPQRVIRLCAPGLAR